MAFGATDRVETATWRNQARRLEDAHRTADSRSARFDDLIARTDASDARAEQTRSNQIKADQARTDSAKTDLAKTDLAKTDLAKTDQPAADARPPQAKISPRNEATAKPRDTASPNEAADARQAPGTAGSTKATDTRLAGAKSADDESAETKGAGAPNENTARVGPKLTDAETVKDTSVAGEVPSSDGTAQAPGSGGSGAGETKPAKAEEAAAAGGDGQGKAVAGLVTPPVQPILPPAVQPASAASVAETPTGSSPGLQAAVAVRGPALPGQAAGPGPAAAGGGATEADGLDTGSDAKTDGPKDFLSVFAEARQDPGQADAPTAVGTLATASQGIAQGSSTAPAASVHSLSTAAPAPPTIPVGQVPMTIGLRALAGSSEFQIRLDPIELGRIDVKLEIDKAKGTVATHLVVDRPDTLALLQRDAGQLQQALAQAGLDSSAGGVNLSLRSDGQTAGQSGGRSGGEGRQGTPWASDHADTLQEAVPVQRLRGYGGLDIRI